MLGKFVFYGTRDIGFLCDMYEYKSFLVCVWNRLWCRSWLCCVDYVVVEDLGGARKHFLFRRISILFLVIISYTMFFLFDIEKFEFFDDVYLLVVCICLGLEKKRVRRKKEIGNLWLVLIYKKILFLALEGILEEKAFSVDHFF